MIPSRILIIPSARHICTIILPSTFTHQTWSLLVQSLKLEDKHREEVAAKIAQLEEEDESAQDSSWLNQARDAKQYIACSKYCHPLYLLWLGTLEDILC